MGDDRRLRILRIKDFFEEYTDENHDATMDQIVEYLKRFGIEANRKTITEDIYALQAYGMEIEGEENAKSRRLVARDFEPLEVDELINCVASSQSLTEKQSSDIVKKLGKLISVYQRRQIDKRLFSNKGSNILYSIIFIQDRIKKGDRIKFKYYEYNLKKELVIGQQEYIVQPIELFYNNGYFLQATDLFDTKIFRVDRMTNITKFEPVLQNMTDKEIEEELKEFDLNTDNKSIWKSMIGDFEVQLLFKNHMIDTVINRFGEEIGIIIADKEHFRTTVHVEINAEFFGWIFSLGDNVMIEYPLEVAALMMDLLKERQIAYKEGHSKSINKYRKNRIELQHR